MAVSRDPSLLTGDRLTDFVQKFKVPYGYDFDVIDREYRLISANHIGCVMLGGEVALLSLGVRPTPDSSPIEVVAYASELRNPVRVRFAKSNRWFPLGEAEDALGPLDHKLGIIEGLHNNGWLKQALGPNLVKGVGEAP
jgi:hypothetical protein